MLQFSNLMTGSVVIGKPVANFLFIITELFPLSLTDEMWKSVKVGVFQSGMDGWVTFSTNFRQKGASPTNHCWCQKTRVIALRVVSVICSALFGFVIKHTCDRQMDRQT